MTAAGLPASSDYPSSTESGEMIAAVIGIYAVVFGIAAIIGAVAWVLMSIGLAAVFRRTGIEPWKAWVPYYNLYVWLQLGGQNGNWVWLSLIPYGSTVTSIFLYIGMHRTGKAFGKSTGFLVLGIFLPWVWAFSLGYGRDEYRPELIAAAGYGPPLVGYGSGMQQTAPGAYPQGGHQPAPYSQTQYQQAPHQQAPYSQAPYQQAQVQQAGFPQTPGQPGYTVQPGQPPQHQQAPFQAPPQYGAAAPAAPPVPPVPPVASALTPPPAPPAG